MSLTVPTSCIMQRHLADASFVGTSTKRSGKMSIPKNYRRTLGMKCKSCFAFVGDGYTPYCKKCMKKRKKAILMYYNKAHRPLLIKRKPSILPDPLEYVLE